MGFFDKIKGAMNAVTGGGATVTVEFSPAVAFPGEGLQVRVTAASTGGEVKGNGVWVDVQGMEQVKLNGGSSPQVQQDISVSRATFEQSFRISGPFQLGAGQQQQWEGMVQLPPQIQPTFDGSLCDHDWGIRGRLETFGNDPDSGYVRFRVGLRG
jgi:hypothetical protein